MSIDRQEVMRSEVKVDIYEDDRPKFFEAYCEGDMDSDTHREDIVINLAELPPGAKVSVEYPCCPDCGQARFDKFEHLPGGRMKVIGHETTCDCGFDWVNWEDEQFS